MPRVVGRKVYASDLSERRVLLSLGVDVLRAPRHTNPYIISRRLKRAAHANPDVLYLNDIAAGRKPQPPRPSPDVDRPDVDSPELEPHRLEAPTYVADSGTS